jgi:hypothetical protein
LKKWKKLSNAKHELASSLFIIDYAVVAVPLEASPGPCDGARREKDHLVGGYAGTFLDRDSGTEID